MPITLGLASNHHGPFGQGASADVYHQSHVPPSEHQRVPPALQRDLELQEYFITTISNAQSEPPTLFQSSLSYL
jgi:hypothetical protein